MSSPSASAVDANRRVSSRLSISANAAYWAAPLLVLVAVYHDAINGWWMSDDSMHLLSVIRYGVAAHFLRPLTELELIPSNLTPWLYASYGIDFALGGLNPRIAYVHHLLSWGATLVVLTLALRRWLGPGIAAAVLIWFILAVPTSTAVQFLSTRHYAEGLLVSTLSVLAYAAYRRSGLALHLALSALLYAWAMTAKEVYVPLGPLLVVHYALFAESGAGSSAQRPNAWDAIRRLWDACIVLWPHVALAGAYVLYRGYMLGFDRLLRGYEVPAWRTRPSMLLDFPATWEWTFHWERWQSVLWLALLGTGIALWFARRTRAQRWRGLAFGFAIAASVLVPIYPVLALLTVYRVNPHYLLIPGLAFFVLTGWASRECVEAFAGRSAARLSVDPQATRRRIEVAIAAILVFLTIAQFRTALLHAWPWQPMDQVAQYRLEGEYELYSTDRSLILNATGPAWHHVGLQQIRRELLQLPKGPSACVAGQCDVAAAQQQARSGICVRYFGNPPRLERVFCSSEATQGAK
jgi:hypothetical protein